MNRRLKWIIVSGLLFCGIAVAGDANKPAGWRNDGSGHFPEAKPPIKWGRTSKTLSAIRWSTVKPAEGAKGDAGRPLVRGRVPEWLIAGVPELPKDFKDFKQEILPGEAEFAPAKAGDKSGKLTWQLVKPKTNIIDLSQLFGSELAPEKMYVAYACTYLFSEKACTLPMTLMNRSHKIHVWVNDKPVGGDNIRRKQFPLTGGWNRVLIRLVSFPLDPKYRKGVTQWYMRPVFYGPASSEYETANISWITDMPGHGVGSPIVVDDRLFVTSEMCNLICINKKSGKYLWIDSSTFYDIATPEERKANAEIFAKLKPDAERLKEINQLFRAGTLPDAKLLGEKAKLEKKLHLKMKKVDKARYALLRAGEAGYAAMTPVTDGTFVYVFFANGVLACYDLEGKRKWGISLVSKIGEHGLTSSPILVGGKLIVYVDSWIRAIDPATGEVIWKAFAEPDPKKPNLNYHKYHGTACPFKIEGEDAVITPTSQVLRVKDGKQMMFAYHKLGGYEKSASPIAHGEFIYNMHKHELLRIKLGKPNGDTVKPTEVKRIKLTYDKHPVFYQSTFVSSPLYYDGIVYCLNNDGVLFAVDANTMDLFYVEPLDLNFSASHGFGRNAVAASPAAAGGNIYLFGNQGVGIVIKPGRTFEAVSINSIDKASDVNSWRQHQEEFTASPTFDGKQMFIRGDRTLYCIGEK